MQEIETDKLKDLGELIAAVTARGAVQADGENYMLTFADVEQLHERYQRLETNIKDTEKRTGAAYLREIDNYLICALKHEARKISDVRDVEYAYDKAKLAAKKREETPSTWRNWWWIFKLKRNRAQQLVDDEAAINAAYLHNIKQAELDRLEKELDEIEAGSPASAFLKPKKRRKLRRKIKRHKRALMQLEKIWRAAEVRESANVQNVEPGNVAAAPLSTATAPGNIKPAKKPKKKVIKPVVIEEIPGQLPGQTSIENADTTN